MVVDDYDELTVDDAKARVREGAVSAAALLAHEREHKDRVTLTEWLEDHIDGRDEPTREREYETVVVANTRSGHIAGMFFENSGEVVETTLTPRVEEAIKRGDFRLNYE